jgi:hypothetical protein
MRCSQALIASVWLALLALAIGPAPLRGESIKSTKEWKGQLDDPQLEKEKPSDGFIVDEKSFAKLWKAWMPDEKLPVVDFTKEIVVVATSNKGIIKGVSLMEEKGDAKAIVGLMEKGIKGFAFAIGVFRREGLKTIDGKPIKK